MPQHTLQCMEVWGGNRAVENGVVMPGLDAWVFSRPYVGTAARGSAEDTSRGGDIHYVTCCATGRITRIVVADVSGHGEKVADTAVELRRLLGRFSNYLDQEKVVAELDRRFLQLGEANERHAGLFATAVIATYWSPTEEITLCNAGHPRPLRYSASAKHWELIIPGQGDSAKGPTNLPLGIGVDACHPQSAFRLRRGDLLLFYTDSLIEARRATGEQLGEAGLLALMKGTDPSRPEALVRDLLRVVGEWRDGGSGAALHHVDALPEFDDDVTLVLVRPNTLGPRPSLGLSLLAAYRISCQFLKSLVNRDVVMSWPQVRRDLIMGSFSKGANGQMDDKAG